jgi:hypothetical protein
MSIVRFISRIFSFQIRVHCCFTSSFFSDDSSGWYESNPIMRRSLEIYNTDVPPFTVTYEYCSEGTLSDSMFRNRYCWDYLDWECMGIWGGIQWNMIHSWSSIIRPFSHLQKWLCPRHMCWQVCNFSRDISFLFGSLTEILLIQEKSLPAFDQLIFFPVMYVHHSYQCSGWRFAHRLESKIDKDQVFFTHSPISMSCIYDTGFRSWISISSWVWPHNLQTMLHSGECMCKTGWNGTLCDKCAADYYGPSCNLVSYG